MHTTTAFPARVLMLGLALVSLPVLAQTNIDSAMTVDNQFTAYLSTNDAVQGTQIGTGNNWPTTYEFSAALTPAVTNYLHIVGTDTGAPAMFIGEFNLNNSGFEFANGTQTLLTNTTHWQVSTTGFGANYFTPSDLGPQGTSPWGSFAGIDAAARFIWHPTGPNNTVYFSAQIIPNGGGGGGGETTRATFTVTKEFTDGDNPTEVEVTIDCFTGLPITQSQTITETQDVTFVVTDFDDGELDCEITEEDLFGYTPAYNPDGPGSYDAIDGCNFQDVISGTENTCHIVNDADFVDVEIEKVWVIEGSGGDDLDTKYKLTLYCDAPIEDADYCHGNDASVDSPEGNGGWTCKKKFYGNDSQVFIAEVQPQYPGSHCWVDESVYDSSVEIDNDCGNLEISAGTGDGCVITNTVFYEGIPTLSQYGMAIMALLMLGVGMVGFRRFA